jgi:hypothetical protein
VFLTAGKCPSSHPPSNDRGDSQRDREIDGREFIKHAAEIGSGTTIYVPSFVKISSGIQKLIEGDTKTHGQHGDPISLLLFSQTSKVC